MSFTILVTSVGGEFGPQLIKYAQESTRHNIKVIGVDASSNAIGRHFSDTFEQVPFGNHKDYVHAILKILENNQVDLILPTSDEEAFALSRKKVLVEDSGAKLACSDYDT
jgi:carbamoyl-phosphate synthase large subunit